MFVIIVGGGKVGTYLASMLLSESHRAFYDVFQFPDVAGKFIGRQNTHHFIGDFSDLFPLRP